MSMRVFLEEIWISRLGKEGSYPKHVLAFSSPLRIWMEQQTGEKWTCSLPSFSPSFGCRTPNSWIFRLKAAFTCLFSPPQFSCPWNWTELHSWLSDFPACKWLASRLLGLHSVSQFPQEISYISIHLSLPYLSIIVSLSLKKTWLVCYITSLLWR